MLYNVQFSAIDIVKIWHLNVQNVNVSIIAKQMKQSRSESKEISLKDNNTTLKKKFSSQPRLMS